MILKKVLSIYISLYLCFYSSFVYAEFLPSSLLKSTSLTSEYFVGKELGKPLIQISLLSGVQKPGVYHIPIGTDLGQLIAYAGGKNQKSNFSKVNIYRTTEQGTKRTIVYDFESILEDSQKMPDLRSNDLIYINEDKVTLEKTSQWVSIVAGVLSIALSAALINQNNK
ncbi:MAG: SLBB domain-containing protein [Bdellovibrionales bacterium]|nr:SLBB domain-containing protein [Bdellovibrionales bacterium]